MNQRERELQDIYYGQIMQGIYSGLVPAVLEQIIKDTRNGSSNMNDNLSVVAMKQAESMIRVRAKA